MTQRQLNFASMASLRASTRRVTVSHAGTPDVIWLSVFFFPQGCARGVLASHSKEKKRPPCIIARGDDPRENTRNRRRFMTANVQNYARQKQIPVDTVQFGHKLLSEEPDELKSKPSSGCYIYGLFLEGARWDKRNNTLTDPKPKELFAPMPVIHLVPEVDRAPNPPDGGIYRCPVYKILTRTGALSTTGHSTNFVFWLEVPSTKPTCYRNSLVSETNAQIKLCDQAYWIKAGVACFCALKY